MIANNAPKCCMLTKHWMGLYRRHHPSPAFNKCQEFHASAVTEFLGFGQITIITLTQCLLQPDDTGLSPGKQVQHCEISFFRELPRARRDATVKSILRNPCCYIITLVKIVYTFMNNELSFFALIFWL